MTEIPEQIQQQIIALLDEQKYLTRRLREVQSAIDTLVAKHKLGPVRIAVVPVQADEKKAANG